MSEILDVACQCGQVAVHVDVPRASSGTRVVCYCADCQAAARHLGAERILLPGGGTEIFQTTPDLLQIAQGSEQLRIQRLSPKGLMRWYAGCCDTPLFNSLPNSKLAFVGVIIPASSTAAADAALGPCINHCNTAAAKPGQGVPTKDVGLFRAVLSLFTRMIGAAVSGRAKLSVLRDRTGVPVTVLSLQERQAATPKVK